MRRKLIHSIALDAWAAGTALLVGLALIESAERGFVSMFFDFDWLALAVLAAAAVALLTHRKDEDKAEAGAKRLSGYWKFAAIGAIAAAVTWIKAPEGLSLAWRTAAASGVLLAALMVRPLFKRD